MALALSIWSVLLPPVTTPLSDADVPLARTMALLATKTAITAGSVIRTQRPWRRIVGSSIETTQMAPARIDINAIATARMWLLRGSRL
jgi:hypothetical protein